VRSRSAHWHIRFTAVALFIALGGLNTAGGAIVPLSECSFCALPGGPLPQGCFFRRTWCDRLDYTPIQLSPGNASFAYSQIHACDNCVGCPDNPPGSPLHCFATLQACFTESITYSIAAGIQAGIPAIQGSFSSSAGITHGQQVCATGECGSPGPPPCNYAEYQLQMQTFNGVVYRMRHQYTTGGQINAHVGMTCTMDGVFWQQSCPDRNSFATGNNAFTSTCRTISSGPCGGDGGNDDGDADDQDDDSGADDDGDPNTLSWDRFLDMMEAILGVDLSACRDAENEPIDDQMSRCCGALRQLFDPSAGSSPAREMSIWRIFNCLADFFCFTNLLQQCAGSGGQPSTPVAD
jgi:hypothetical protein